MALRGFKLNWVLKAIVFKVLDRIPAGEKIYYLLQHYVTKSVPRALSPTRSTGEAYISHINKFKNNGVDLTQAHLLEIGAGWDLYSNMIMYCMGINRQYVVDLRRLVKAETVNAAIQHLQADPPEGAVRVPDRLIRGTHVEDDLSSFYGISYKAPADARRLPVEDASFDLIVTTDTLEHIPKDILYDIMKECSRVLRPPGLMSHIVDYSDHYAHSDSNINEFNYLQFNEYQWKKFNPGIHFQNRLRTRFYSDLFMELGFEIVKCTTRKGQAESLQKITVSEPFKDIPFEELLELGGNYLLRKQ